jgi:hypothetical protein
MDLNHARLPIPPLRPEESCADHAGRQQSLVLQRHQTVSITRPKARSHPPQRGSLCQKELPMTLPAHPRPIPEQQAKEIRRLSHDLSNALEIVLQTSFLLGTVDLDDDAKKWRTMLDNGVQQAAELNRQLREYVRGNS